MSDAKKPIEVIDRENATLRERIAVLETVLGDFEEDKKARAAAEEDLKQAKAYHGLPLEEKNRRRVEALFPMKPGDQIFYVQLPDQPHLGIPARDRHEAIVKYNTICGIVRTEHHHVVGTDP